MILKPLRESVREPREAPDAHSQVEILALHVACGDVLGVTISGDGTNDGPVGTGTLDGRLRKTPWPTSTHRGAERRRTHPRRAPVVHAHIRTFGLRSTLEGSGRPVAGIPPPHGPADDTPVGERRCPWRPGRREGHVSVEQQHVNQRVLSTCRTRAGSPAKIRTWAAAHEAHVTTFHSANARVRSAR